MDNRRYVEEAPMFFGDGELVVPIEIESEGSEPLCCYNYNVKVFVWNRSEKLFF